MTRVLVKTMALPGLSLVRIHLSRASLWAWSSEAMTCWVMAGVSSRTVLSCNRRGVRWTSSTTRRSAALPLVAENNSVCRAGGQALASFMTSSVKPMSSMRSASSRTSTWMSDRIRLPAARCSRARPGVAMMMSGFLRIFADWTLKSSPPVISSALIKVNLAKFCTSLRICRASSRVGNRISARGAMA